VLTLPPSIRIYLAKGVTDMRKQIDSLAAMVAHVLEQDPFSGHLFGFCNRARNRAKFLYWEESGYWLLHKRLEKGRFTWPDGDAAAIQLDAAELHALLGGLDFTSARRRRWYRRKTETVKPLASMPS
jgi:transposase